MYYFKQAGTGPSRRHIQGSKIAKRLPSVKYLLLQYSKIENFSKKLHTQKNGPSGAPGPASATEISIDFGFSIDRLRVKESIEYGYIRSQNESNNVHNSITQLAKDQIILVNKNNNSKHK